MFQLEAANFIGQNVSEWETREKFTCLNILTYKEKEDCREINNIFLKTMFL